MEFLGVGPTEFLFIIIIALIVLGPKDLAKTGRTVGKWLNSMIQSDTWKVVQKTSKELRQLPTQLMREDNLEKFLTEGNQQPSAGTKRVPGRDRSGKNRVSPRADLDFAQDKRAERKNENVIHPPVTVAGPAAEILKPAKKKPAAATRKKPAPTKKTEKKPADQHHPLAHRGKSQMRKFFRGDLESRHRALSRHLVDGQPAVPADKKPPCNS